MKTKELVERAWTCSLSWDRTKAWILMSGHSVCPHRNCWKPFWSYTQMRRVDLVASLSACCCRHLLLGLHHSFQRVLRLCWPTASTWARCLALWALNLSPLTVWFLLDSFPYCGHRRADFTPLRSSLHQISRWAALKFFLDCFREHSPGNRPWEHYQSGESPRLSVVQDRCFRHVLAESSPGPPGIHVPREARLQAPGKLEKFILGWDHTIMGSRAATWHPLRSHLSSSLTRLSLPICGHEFGTDRGVCVSVCVCACMHRFSDAFLCTLLDTRTPLFAFNITSPYM